MTQQNRVFLCFSSLPAISDDYLIKRILPKLKKIVAFSHNTKAKNDYYKNIFKCKEYLLWSECIKIDNPWQETLDYEQLKKICGDSIFSSLPLVERTKKDGKGSIESFNRYIKCFSYVHNILQKTNPNLILFLNVPVHPLEYFIYKIAKHRGIEILMARHGLLPGSWIVTRNGRDTETWNTNNKLNIGLRKEYLRDLDYHIKTVQNNDYLPAYMHRQGLTSKNSRVSLPKYIIDINLKNSLKAFIQRRSYRTYATTNTLTNRKIIYVALHYQPEATSMPLAGDFVNQTLMIKLLSDELPDNYEIFVKEHPTSVAGKAPINFSFRNASDYKTIKSIPKVRLIDYTISSPLLIKESAGVVTLTGTIGLEALILGKPVLIFGDAAYEGLTGVVKYKGKESVVDFIKWTNRRVNIETLYAEMKQFGNFSVSPSMIGDDINIRNKGKLLRLMAIERALDLAL